MISWNLACFLLNCLDAGWRLGNRKRWLGAWRFSKQNKVRSVARLFQSELYSKCDRKARGHIDSSFNAKAAGLRKHRWQSCSTPGPGLPGNLIRRFRRLNYYAICNLVANPRRCNAGVCSTNVERSVSFPHRSSYTYPCSVLDGH